MISDPMNPNTIFTFLRKTNRIISQRVIDQPGVNKSNFIFKKVIGKSQFGTVWLVNKIPECEPLVMKVMEKNEIYRRRCVDTVLNERILLSELHHPYIGNIKYAF